MKENAFTLTVEEANILDKIATATKMDAWFYIDEDLHVRDIEEGNISSDAEGVCLLEDGLAYGLDEPQSGGLNPEEIKIAEACFKRARAAKSPKHYYSVPVVYEMCGSVTVEAGSAEEAYDRVKNHPEDFGLPDEAFYVDDSFRVADDDRENAVETIEMLDDAPADDAASGRRTGLTVKATPYDGMDPYSKAIAVLSDNGMGQQLTTALIACACRNALDAFEDEENIMKTPFEEFCKAAMNLWLDCDDGASICHIADKLVQWIIHHPEDANYPDSYPELADWAEENL